MQGRRGSDRADAGLEAPALHGQAPTTSASKQLLGVVQEQVAGESSRIVGKQAGAEQHPVGAGLGAAGTAWEEEQGASGDDLARRGRSLHLFTDSPDFGPTTGIFLQVGACLLVPAAAAAGSTRLALLSPAPASLHPRHEHGSAFLQAHAPLH